MGLGHRMPEEACKCLGAGRVGRDQIGMDLTRRRLSLMLKAKFKHVKGFKQTRNMIRLMVKEGVKVEKLAEEGWLEDHGKTRHEMMH